MVFGIKKIRLFAFLAAIVGLISCGSRKAAYVPLVAQAMPDAVVALTTISSQQPQAAPEIQKEDAVETVTATDTWLSRMQSSLDTLCHSSLFQTTQLGLYIYDLTTQEPVYTINADQRMRPASCQKLVTSIAALHYLGENYKFTTGLYITGSIAGRILKGDVYIVGGMDPLLSPSDLAAFATALKNRGIDQVAGRIYIDLTMKDDLPYGWGWCWDDKYGPLSALMINGRDGFGEQWLRAMRSAGIRLSHTGVTPRILPSTGTVHLATAAHSIDEVLEPMMKKSDNIYAECLFYQIAAMGGQKQAGRKHVAEHIRRFLESIGQDEATCQVADGSGLSLYNYLTPQVLVALLNYAYQTPSVGNHLMPVLPIAGVDGTLEKRMKDSAAQGNVRAKTGTLEAISSLAGYLKASNGHDLSFCIINQGIVHSSQGRDFQDKICILLCQGFQ